MSVVRKRVDPVADSLGAIIMAAVREAEEMRAAGADAAEVARGLEAVVRDRWPKPKGRTEPWRYLCESCSDTGLVLHSEVNRLGIHVTTGYPCVCEKGARFILKPKMRTAEDAVARAAKVSKPTRFGR